MPSEDPKAPVLGVSPTLHVPVTLVVFAISLVLSLLASSGSVLQGQFLEVSRPTWESFWTHPWVHADGYHLTGNLLLFALVGGIAESCWGSWRFLVLYVCTAAGAAAVSVLLATWTGASGISCGSGAFVFGGLIALGVRYPEHRLIWSLPAVKYLSWSAVFLLGALLALLDSRSTSPGTFLLPQASGAVFGLVLAVGEPLASRWVERTRASRQRRREARLRTMRGEVDRLLQKISERGMDSLTRGERHFLREASHHYRDTEPCSRGPDPKKD